MYKLLYKKLLPLCLILLCLGAQAAHASTLKIGVLSFQSKEETLKKWTYLKAYLTKNSSSPAKFKIVPMFYDELDTAVAKGSIDFVLTNTAHYIRLEQQYGISAITSLEKKVGNTLLDSFGGVIFTRSDRSTLITFMI